MADEATERITILLQARDKDLQRAIERNNKLMAGFERQATRATTTAAQTIDRNMSRMGASFSSARGQIQNAAFQLGDFATQVGAGTSASIALGQQLPQLLGGFGALGAVMGALVAVGVPLASSLLDTGDAAEVLKKSLESVEGSISGLESAYGGLKSAQAGYADAVRSGNRELAASYLDLIALQERAVELQRQQAQVALRENRELLREAQSQVAEAQAALDSFQAAASRRTNLTGDMAIIDTEAYAEAASYLAEMTSAAEQIASAVELAQLKVEIFGQESAVASGEMQESVMAAESFAALMPGVTGVMESLAAKAGAVATNMWSAANAAAVMVQFQAEQARIAAGPDERGSQRTARSDAAQYNTEQTLASLGLSSTGRPLPTPSTGGGRSGGGGTPGPAEPEYWDTLMSAVQDAQDALEAYNDTAEDGADRMADLFTSVVDGSKTAQEALADLLMELAKVSMQNAFLGLAGADSPLQPLFAAIGSAFGGFKAEGGPVSAGMSYVVGENGPEMFTPSTAGMITPNHALGGGGGSTTIVNVDARYATEGTAEMIAAAFRRNGPALVRESVAQVDRQMRLTKSFGNQR